MFQRRRWMVTYAIPMQFEMAMRAFLAWQDHSVLASDEPYPITTLLWMRGKMFKSQLSLAKRMYKPFRYQEAYQVAIESQVMTLKP